MKFLQQRRQEAGEKFVHRTKMETLPANLDSYERTLRMIVEIARKAGVEPIFMPQAPDRVVLDEEARRTLWMGAMDGGKTYVKEEQLRELLAAYNDRMRIVCKDEKVTLIDLPMLFEDNSGLFTDGHHFNERGARVTARAVTDELWKTVFQYEKRE